MRNQSVFVLALAALSAFSSNGDVQTIIQNSVAANERDWQVSPDYSYLERDKSPDGTKTYRVFQLLGSPYEDLVDVNQEPLPSERRESEKQKLEQVTQQRQNESPQQRQERIMKYQKDRERDHLFLDQMVDAFNFKLLGRKKMDGFNVYVLSATPRPGYQPPNIECRALTGMRGKLWIDTKTFQWVKVTAQVVRPVSVEGFLATIEPGTRFDLEQMPVANGVWLPKHFAMQSRARILFFFNRRRQEDETYSNYQRSTPERNGSRASGY